MSLHPVSLNVIRQAMHWSGFPQPIAITKFDQETQPTGAVWTAYQMEFRYSDLTTMTPPGWRQTIEPDNVRLRRALERCFCDDVIVLWVETGYKDSPVYARIVTKLSPKGGQ